MSGNLTAKNATITGQLTVGTTTYSSAANLFSGANTAYNNSSTWSTGAGYGYNYKDATTSGTSSYPTYFKCSYLTIAGGGYISMGGVPYVAKTATINGVTIKYLGTS